MSTAFITLDLNWRFTYVNGAAERMLGRPREVLLNADLWTMLPELRGTEAGTRYRQALTGGSEVGFEHYHPPLDAWFDVRAIPSEDGLSVYFHDITGRVRAQQDVARLAGERAEALAASGAATGRLQILSGAGARLAGTLEVDELLQILSDVIVNGFGTAVIVALKERIIRDLAGKETTPTGGGGFRVAHVAGVDEALRGSPIPAAALAAGAVQDREARELDERLGSRSALTLPLVSRGRMLGAIIVLDPVTGALDRRVLIELAARAGVALDNAVLYGSERRLALTLQRSLLPTEIPDVPGIELATRYLPGTGGRDVGGDFYIAHPLEDGRVLLVIGDVMGHGAQAAARMGQLRAVLAALRLRRRPARPRARAPERARPDAAGPADGDRPRRRVRPGDRAAHVLARGASAAADRAARRRALLRGRTPRPAAGRRGQRVRPPRHDDPAARDARLLHGRPDRGTHARDRRRDGAPPRRPRRRRPPAGRGGRPRAACAGPRARRRGRHRPAGHAGVAPSSNAATEDSPRNHTRRPRRITTSIRPSR